MTSAPAIGFEYRPSRWMRRLLIGMAALALIAVMGCAGPLWLKPLLGIAVLLAAWRSIRGLAATPVRAAGWGADNQWTLHLASREDIPAALVSFRVLGTLVLLRLRTAQRGMQVLVLSPDNSDADIRRRLRMRLATVQAHEALPRI